MKSFTNSLIQLVVGDGAPVRRLLVLDLNISAIRGWSDGTRGMRGGKRVRLLHWNCTEKEYNNEFGQIMTAMQNYVCVCVCVCVCMGVVRGRRGEVGEEMR